MVRVSLQSLKCIRKESWGWSNDSILITIAADAGTPSAKKLVFRNASMGNGDVWDLSGKEFDFQNKVSIKIHEEDYPDPNDLLGEAVLGPTDLGAHQRNFTKGANYSLLFVANPVIDVAPGPLPSRPGKLEQDKDGSRWILCVDGGGLRGLIPLLALARLERYYGRTCAEMFDMVAGTSTGSIIAGLLAKGETVANIISLYNDPAKRRQIFTPNSAEQSATLRAIKVGNWTVGEIANAVAYVPSWGAKINDILDKTVATLAATPYYQKGMTALLDSHFGQKKLSECAVRLPDGTNKNLDVFITAKDAFRSETAYLTAFHDRDSGAVRGTYRNMRLKDAVEASASAPVFFAPKERFVDGGVGSFNNPSFVAATEALKYSGVDVDTPQGGQPFYQPYAETRDAGGRTRRTGTVVWSFGTANAALRHTAQSLAAHKLLDFWMRYVIDESFEDAAQQQSYLCRNLLPVKFMRYDLRMTPSSLRQIGVLNRNDYQLIEMTTRVKLDSVDERDFGAIREVAALFAEYLERENAFAFSGSGLELGFDLNAVQALPEYRDHVLEALDF